jgi:hypothetical protein
LTATVVITLARSDSGDFAYLGFFLSIIGQIQTACGFFLGGAHFDENAIAQGFNGGNA